MEITPQTRIIDLTVSQLVELIESTIGKGLKETVEPTPKRLVYGIPGIAMIFGCSSSTAQRIKKSGVIEAAINQNGHLIITDADLAVKLWKEHKSIKIKSI